MSILLWTFAPVVALFVAIAWAHLINRPRGPVQARESVEAYERFRRAMAEPRRPDHDQIAAPKAS